jgi:hypothetical protein
METLEAAKKRFEAIGNKKTKRLMIKNPPLGASYKYFYMDCPMDCQESCDDNLECLSCGGDSNVSQQQFPGTSY